MVSNMKIRRDSRRVCLDEVVFDLLDEHLAGLIGRSTIRSGSQSAYSTPICLHRPITTIYSLTSQRAETRCSLKTTGLIV